MSEQESYESRSAAEQGPPPPPEPKASGGGELDPDAWMVTFSDLLTLLMTFFVLIFASQDPSEDKIQQAFGQRGGVFGLYRKSFLDQVIISPRQDVSEDKLEVFLEDVGSVDIEVKQEEQGLVVTLPADAYFEPNSTALNARAIKRVGQLAEFLSITKHQIQVVGHTDNQETGVPVHASPWDLSIARANSVMQRLINSKIPEDRLSLVGYGPSRPRFTNVSRKGRSRNRRVEILILNRGQLQ